MKKRYVLLLTGILAVTLSACGPNKAAEAVTESEEIEKEGKKSEGEEEGENTEEEGEEPEVEESLTVGILLPEKGTKDQEYLSQKFEAEGYEVKVLTADGDGAVQKEQLESLIQEDVDALVIDPVDPYGLTETLAKTERQEEESTEEEKKKDIPVFSYDTLIRDTEFVKYYAAFDTRAEGKLVGEEIIKRKELEKAREEKTSYTIEFLMGTPEDVTELFFYNGILESLQEYLDDGTLVCRSEKLSFDDTCVMRGSALTARGSLEAIMDEFYEGGAPDIICTAKDAYAIEIVDLLASREYTLEKENLPLLTGFGSDANGVKAVAEGKIGFTLFQDREELVDVCLKMVDGYLTGEKVKVDNYSQYDNGKKIIGTYTCEAKLIDQNNYQLLVDNGTYTENEIMPEILTPTPEPTLTPSEEPSLTVTPAPEEAKTSEEEKTSIEEKLPAGTPIPEKSSSVKL